MKQKIRPVSDISGTGLGARHPHLSEILEKKPSVGFLEVHSENFFVFDSFENNLLEELGNFYPLSLHGVGLSLGSTEKPDRNHLETLKKLIHKIKPVFVSEHLSWSMHDGTYVPDLLPLPMTEEALTIIIQNIDYVQNELDRRILIENPSKYIDFNNQDLSEPDFLREVAQKTGCGLILDVNNIHVSAHNLGFNAQEYIDNIPANAVEEIHLAGYSIQKIGQEEIFIDTHDHRVYQDVWDLYQYTLQKIGDKNTLIEWDSDLPELSVLVEEALKADNIRQKMTCGEKNAHIE